MIELLDFLQINQFIIKHMSIYVIKCFERSTKQNIYCGFFLAFCFKIRLLSINMFDTLQPNCNGSEFFSIIFINVKRDFKVDLKIYLIQA